MDLAGMTDAEYINYSTNLIPRLMRKRPGEWTLVTDIATNPGRFIEVVECLASYRIFDNTEGYCMIELNADVTRIRVDPNAIRFRNDSRYQWKFSSNLKNKRI